MTAAAAPTRAAMVLEVPVDKIVPSPHQNRVIRDDDPALADLATSIRTHGVLEPVLLRTNGHGWVLMCGERRVRATRLAGLATVPAIVRDVDDRTAAEITVEENLRRQDLTPLEEAAGVATLLGLYGGDHAAVAERVGASPSWVARRARLTKLTKTWRKRATDPKSPVSQWSAAMLELVARLPAAQQDELLRGDRWDVRGVEESDSAPDLERVLARRLHVLSSTPWKHDDAELVSSAGACAVCPKRSAAAPLLWADGGDGKDRCLDAACWAQKLAAHVRRRAEELQDRTGGDLLLVADSTRRGPVPELAEKAVAEYSVREAKKSDPSARLCLRVGGERPGTTFWGVVSSSSSSGSSANGKGAKRTMVEKRKILANRRRSHVLSAIAELLDAMPRPAEVLVLVAAYGLNWRRDSVGHDGWERADTYDASGMGQKTPLPAELLERGLAQSAEERLDVLWRGVLPVLARRWKYDTYSVDRVWQDVQAAAPLLSIDLDALHDAAVVALPEPKAWAKEVPPKTKSAKGKAKRKAKAKSVSKSAIAARVRRKRKAVASSAPEASA